MVLQSRLYNHLLAAEKADIALGLNLRRTISQLGFDPVGGFAWIVSQPCWYMKSEPLKMCLQYRIELPDFIVLHCDFVICAARLKSGTFQA